MNTINSNPVTASAIPPKAFKIGGNQLRIGAKQPRFCGTPLNKNELKMFLTC